MLDWGRTVVQAGRCRVWLDCSAPWILRCGLAAVSDQVSAPRLAFLEVEDDGPGVPAAERERILERFYRASGTVGEGNGLGLAIADEIARVHHAKLLVSDGAKGRGLRVTLQFPAADSA